MQILCFFIACVGKLITIISGESSRKMSVIETGRMADKHSLVKAAVVMVALRSKKEWGPKLEK